MIAEVGFDTAENEPCKSWKFCQIVAVCAVCSFRSSEERAATRIQAAFRGRKARRKASPLTEP